MADFEAEYGYPLGVPVNWSAYEDIAEFFTGRDLSHLGVEGEVYGNMDYGKKDPSLGWRYTDAWMSMAGMGDVGEPNGLPVDEWGIRVNENSQPVGSCVRAAGPPTRPRRLCREQGDRMAAEVLAARRRGHDLLRGRSGPGAGQCRAADVLVHRLHRRHGRAGPAGDERGRHAEMAHGPLAARRLLERRQKVGYQDVGSWTLMKSTPVDRAKAAWLYAQFVTSKTVDLKKSDVGLTFIRESTINSDHFTERAPQAGRSDRVLPLAGPRALVAHGHQRARLSASGAAVVAEYRRRDVRPEDRAGGAGRRSARRRKRCWSGWSAPAFRAIWARS
jgi:glycerol transport system substrate-binding protein